MNAIRTNVIRLSATLVCGLGVAAPAPAQWSHNPAANSGLVTGGSDQNQAKSLPTADGGWYLVWLDGIGSGWDSRLQRYNARGIPQWPGNGVLVADTAFSSTQPYGFAVDATGNAIVAYRDDDNAGAPVNIKVQKIDPSGALLWGSGVQVSVATGGNAPAVCATSDGGAVAGWSDAAGARFQKVDPAGSVLWTAGGVIDTLAVGSPSVVDVQAGDNGSAIALYIKGSVPRHLFARKFDSTGAKVWNSATTPLPVFDEAGNGVQFGTPIAFFVPDGSGGAIFTWYGTGGSRNAHVQHVNAAGVEQFPHNGATIADTAVNRIRISASASRDPTSGDIYMIAKESQGSPQGNYNILVQRFNSAGVRQWGDAAIALFAPGADQPTFAWAQALAGGGAMFTWDNGPFNSQKVFATRLTAAGAFAWTPNIIEVCSLLSGKGRLWISPNAARTRGLVTWSDNRTASTDDIYGQCVNLDGSLGNPGDVNDDGVVNVIDLLAVINGWGACAAPPTFCPGDISPAPAGDGQIDVLDLLSTINNWG